MAPKRRRAVALAKIEEEGDEQDAVLLKPARQMAAALIEELEQQGIT